MPVANPPNRPDPIDLLEESSKDRIQDLIPIRYGRMLHSPFTFFRGTAAVMSPSIYPQHQTQGSKYRPVVIVI